MYFSEKKPTTVSDILNLYFKARIIFFKNRKQGLGFLGKYRNIIHRVFFIPVYIYYVQMNRCILRFTLASVISHYHVQYTGLYTGSVVVTRACILRGLMLD